MIVYRKALDEYYEVVMDALEPIAEGDLPSHVRPLRKDYQAAYLRGIKDALKVLRRKKRMLTGVGRK